MKKVNILELNPNNSTKSNDIELYDRNIENMDQIEHFISRVINTALYY